MRFLKLQEYKITHCAQWGNQRHKNKIFGLIFITQNKIFLEKWRNLARARMGNSVIEHGRTREKSAKIYFWVQNFLIKIYILNLHFVNTKK